MNSFVMLSLLISDSASLRSYEFEIVSKLSHIYIQVSTIVTFNENRNVYELALNFPVFSESVFASECVYKFMSPETSVCLYMASILQPARKIIESYLLFGLTFNIL